MMGEQNDLLQISPTAWDLIGKQWSHSSYVTQVIACDGAIAGLGHAERREGFKDLTSHYYGNLEIFVAAKG